VSDIIGWCPQCGAIRVGGCDEDGCCSCGCTCTGPGADEVAQLLVDNERLKRDITRYLFALCILADADDSYVGIPLPADKPLKCFRVRGDYVDHVLTGGYVGAVRYEPLSAERMRQAKDLRDAIRSGKWVCP